MGKSTDKISQNYYLLEGIKFENLKLRSSIEKVFGKSFVIESFQYHKLVMDYAIIVNDKLIEVAHVRSEAELIEEWDVVGRAGKISFNKHNLFRKGKYIAGAFYILAPQRLIKKNELPEHYGLLTYSPGHYDVEISLAADYVHENYLKGSFYKTLARDLTRQLYIEKNIGG